ncbi:unnamed protein product [Acanthoscelides obtectus]|uniref:Uncharacterized protein n=1 Tax=Acanthoscelides obtectus TaxID=200917 RepID=A0A9P0QB91_ACAOB|nr:unnamed protein product [Acanthoscelides obtectus]CAK1685316.1 hypothetical protein AOBTE_LOCUS35327 [Acanthoscelides obtectus]
MDNSSCCPSNTHKTLFGCKEALGVSGIESVPMLRTLRIRIQDPFFVAC